MSLFRTIQARCPSCAEPVSIDLVHSVNADRRSALRDEILARTFQQQGCPSCGDQFRIEPEFSYVHQRGKQWLSVWPASKLAEWDACEARGRKAFDMFYGAQAEAAAQALGHELQARVVFGWEAVHEKLVAADAGLDDLTLELAKIALFRDIDGLGPGDDVELRLLGVDDRAMLVFGLFETGSEVLKETLDVPRTLLAEIAADAAWQPLRAQLSEGLFVDVARLMIEPRALATA